MKLFLILLFSVSLVACQFNADVSRELAVAEAYLQEAPDSALRILGRIDPDGIRGKRVRAEYALLYSMALDKNYIFVKSDSLIRITRDFYRHSGDLRKRYLSNYYYGLVLHNRAENAEALVNYLEAERDGLKIGDSYYLGLLYNEISDLYKSQYDHVNFLKYARKSFEHYRRAGKNHHSAYALYNMGDAYANLEQPDSAKRYFRSSIELFETHCDTVVIAYTLSPLALAHLADEEPQAAVAALWEIRRQWHTEWSDLEYAYMASAYHAMNRLDSACYYLGQAAVRTPADPQAQAQLNSIAAPIHTDMGAYRQAAEEYRHYAFVQDSLCRLRTSGGKRAASDFQQSKGFAGCVRLG